MKHFAIVCLFACALFTPVVLLRAAWDGQPYSQGETLDPECLPTDTNCDVDPTVDAAHGGTGLTSYSNGDLLYASSATTLGTLALGIDGKVLKVVGGALTWADDDAGTAFTADGNGIELSGPTFSLELDGASLAKSADGLRISATYAGQNTITTLGTITTGVWNGTAIGDAYLTKSGNWTGTFDGIEGTAYAILAGQAGGQTLNGGTASGENLTLASTSHATKGKILFGTSGYDEANNLFGIGLSAPTEKLHVRDTRTTNGSAGIYIEKSGIVASGTSYGLDMDVTGASNLNIGGYFSARQATSNYSMYVPSNNTAGSTNWGLYIESPRQNYFAGSVGIGTSTPASKLDIVDTTLAGSGALAGSILNTAQTWNTTGAPTAIKLNVTDTASDAASLLMDLQLGAATRFKVKKDGQATITTTTGGTGILYLSGASGGFSFGTDTSGGFAQSTTAGKGMAFYNNDGSTFLKVGGSGGITGTSTTLSGSDATSLLSFTQTWNTTGTPTAFKINITNTASNAASLLMDLQADATSQFKVSKAGAGTFASTVTSGGFIGGQLSPSNTSLTLKIRGGAGATTFSGTSIDPLATSVITSGTHSTLEITSNSSFSPTSGTGVFNSFLLSPVINQTGGASGISRGIYINPTLTAAADFRALEISAGRTVLSGTELTSWGGTTSSFPALKRNGSALDVRLADDTNYAGLTVGYLTATNSDIKVGAGSAFTFNGRSGIASPADGIIRLVNNAFTDFGRLQFGGTTSSFPAIKRSGTGIEIRLADDSAYAPLTSSTILTSSLITSNGGYLTAGGNAAITSTGSSVIASGSFASFNNQKSFAPTSGTGVFAGYEYNGTINQTGGANGISRGLYINPTLTAAADFRALEISTGRTVLSGNELTSWGGITSSFPAIKRNSAALDFRLADDSGFASVNTRNIVATQGFSMGNGLTNTSIGFGFGRNFTTGGMFDAGRFGFQFTRPGNADRLDLEVYNASGALVTGNALSVDSAGNFGVGTNSPGSYKQRVLATRQAASGDLAIVSFENAGTSSADVLVLKQTGEAGSAESTFINFFTNAGTIGNINSNGAGVVSYNTTSDRRLKDNIEDTEYGIDDVLKIQVREYTMRQDSKGLKQTGFIAQELAAIYPDAVSAGTDDGISPLNGGSAWSIDYGRLTPLLVKSIQDQQNLLGEIADKEALDLALEDAQNEGNLSALEYISQKIQEDWRPLLNFAALRVTAIRGYFDEIFAKKTHTEEICVGTPGNETCLNKAELDALLSRPSSGSGSSAPVVVPTASDPDPDPAPATEEDTSEEPPIEAPSDTEPAAESTP